MARYKHIDTHHWVRQFRQYGHTVKLMASIYTSNVEVERPRAASCARSG